jgi:NTE family protein
VVGEVATPETSPYSIPRALVDAEAQFRRLLDEHVPFEALADPPADGPRLLVGAADVLDGEFRVFRSHPSGRYGADRITSEVILASAAIPTIFRAPRLCRRIYWDGLFSQNPPLRELPDAARERHGERASAPPPEELWVIQVNPDTRAHEPTAIADIRDRRNELSANVSFGQEIHFIAYLNQLIRHHQAGAAEGSLLDAAGKRLGAIKIRCIAMDPGFAAPLDAESKLQRSPAFLRELIEHGEHQAHAFLDHLEAGGEDADRHTALEGRDIWGRWTKDIPPCR